MWSCPLPAFRDGVLAALGKLGLLAGEGAGSTGVKQWLHGLWFDTGFRFLSPL